jgi:hypothetical protein
MNSALLGLSTFVYFSGLTLYLWDTLRGKNAPNRMTFLIWAVGPFIAFAGGLASGGSWALLPVFLAGFGPFLVFFASFVNPKAYWKLGILDYTCGVLAVLALIAWAVTSNPAIAIFFAILADALAGFPTIIKSWKFPETETGLGYVAAWMSAFIGFIIAPNNSFPAIGFLVYLLFLNGSLIIAIYQSRFIKFFITV